MKSVKVLIKEVEDVKKFNKAVCGLDFDVDVMTMNDRHCINAKSLLGLFSLNLSEPVKAVLCDECSTDENLERLKEVLKDFIV